MSVAGAVPHFTGKERSEMVGEDISEKSVNIGVRIGKATGRELLRAVEKLLIELKNNGKTAKMRTGATKGKPKHGRTTLANLKAQSGDDSRIELKHADLRLLNQAMKKHDVSFAVKKNGKDKHIMFFKAREVDYVTAGLQEYANKVLKRHKENPSIEHKLVEAKKISQELAQNKSKEKNRNRGGLER